MTDAPARPLREDLKWVMALVLAFMLILAVAPGFKVAPGFERSPAGTEDLQAIAAFIFGDYALPFEVLSLILLVALVAAIYMARLERPDEEGGDVE